MTELERFMEEVVGKGAEQCLPRNLSDYWLRALSESADELLGGDPLAGSRPVSEADKPGALPLAAVLRILEHKGAGRGRLRVTRSKLVKHLEAYRLELGLEEVHRGTDLKYEPATLDDILTNRMVTTWRL